jgi:hypothetical protein
MFPEELSQINIIEYLYRMADICIDTGNEQNVKKLISRLFYTNFYNIKHRLIKCTIWSFEEKQFQNKLNFTL